MNYAPIALFVYNRALHTARTLEALADNDGAKESELIVFCDGAKNEKAKEGVEKVRSYVKRVSGFKNLTVIERDENYGLAKSIITGVSEVVDKRSRVIVMEDDLVTSKYFLTYMNRALDLYENDSRVISIHGYVYPVKEKLPSTFFLKGADCWGWATWKRGWQLFEADGQKLLNELKERNLTKEFDFNSTQGFTKMLADQIAGKNNSWAIRWNASAFLADKLTLYPGVSFVDNIGTDGSGTHCAPTDVYRAKLAQALPPLGDIDISPNKEAYNAFASYFKRSRREAICSIIKTTISSIFKKKG